MTGNVIVAVRIRPLDSREVKRNAKSILKVTDDQISISPPSEIDKNGRKAARAISKVFRFDYAFNSFDKASNYASQDVVYNKLGAQLIEKAIAGYNCCIFAYGQTGSGKSYSMMGLEHDQGLIPLICKELFRRIAEQDGCQVECSYLEIYNERVRDLLRPGQNLRVREHPITGPYVKDLAKLLASSYTEVERFLKVGNKSRSVASTAMNETSSRSHAVFSLMLTQRRTIAGIAIERVSKISLVDLAGSERAYSTGASGSRLKEGAEINKSLSTLGRVISALANQTPGEVVPYRDSTLTWLLKDSLGGNSMTAMLATISPADLNYEETLSTLRYADSAKRIMNHAVVNEDQNMRIIRELQDELASLKATMGGRVMDDELVTIRAEDGSMQQISRIEVAERLEQSSKLMQEMQRTWEERLAETQRIQKEREETLEELGIRVDAMVGIGTPKRIPHLINLSEDPLLSECLIYNIRGHTLCGSVDNSEAQIKLSGGSIMYRHCEFLDHRGSISIVPFDGAMVMINGQQVHAKQELRSGYRIILGREASHIFRFNNPEQVRHERARSVYSPTPQPVHGFLSARREAASGLLGDGSKVDELDDEEINQLFENLHRVRLSRRVTSPLPMVELVDGTQGSPRQTSSMSSIALEDNRSQAQSERKASRNMLDQFIAVRKETRHTSLARKVFDRLRSLHKIRLARELLEMGHNLKEAQVLAIQLDVQIKFQFTIWAGPLPASPLDEEIEVDNVENKPHVMIRVQDETAMSIWTFQNLVARLLRARDMLNRTQNPRLARQAFLVRPRPTYSLLGTAQVKIDRATTSSKHTLDVCAAHVFTTIAVLEVSYRLSSTNDGHKLALEIRTLSGLPAHDIESILIYAYFTLDRERHFATNPQVVADPIKFNNVYHCPLALNDLPDQLNFEVYGAVKPGFFERLDAWDALQFHQPDLTPVLCRVKMLELDSVGEYTAAKVYQIEDTVDSFFYIHQGLSRRLTIELQDQSIAISEAFIDLVFVNGGHEDQPCSSTQLKIIRTSSEAMTFQWDSSAHNTILLDRTTPANQYVILALRMAARWKESDLYIKTQLKVRVHGRDEDPGWLTNFFSTHKVWTCCTKVFGVPCEKVTSDQFNTIHIPLVRETSLPTWTPRGIDLIRDYTRAVKLSGQNQTGNTSTGTVEDLSDDLEDRVVASYTKPGRIYDLVPPESSFSSLLILHSINRFCSVRGRAIYVYHQSQSELVQIIPLRHTKVHRKACTFTVNNVELAAKSEELAERWLTLLSRLV